MNADHALYAGEVWHHRQRPVAHGFRYPFWWLWLDLDDIDGLLARSPWWGRRWRPVVIREADYLGGGPDPLVRRCRQRAAELGMDWRQGRIFLLSQPRVLGWLFNPLSLYWHFPVGSEQPDGVIAEVHNTPWHERHCYALPLVAEPGGPYRIEHDKAFHVSPFMAMAMRYQWQLSQDARGLEVTIRNVDEHGGLFAAGVRLRREPADADGMVSVLRRYPFQTIKASAAIYAHAWRLWRKGVPFYRHPRKQPSVTE